MAPKDSKISVQSFSFFPPAASRLDIHSLSLFRIFLGLYLCYDAIARTSLGKYDLAWYTSEPAERSYLRVDDTPHKAPLHQIWFFRGSFQLQSFLFCVAFLSSLCWSLGLGTQFSSFKVLFWILQVSQHSRCMMVSDGSDSIVRHLLFWSIFLPLSEVWSLDNMLGRRRACVRQIKRITFVQGLACWALTTQIMLMYVGTALHRTLDLYGFHQLHLCEWWWPKLTAVHYALSDAFAARDNMFTRFIRSDATVSKSLTLCTIILEVIAPLLAWSNLANLRPLAGVLLWSLHAGLLLCFRLPNWQIVGMVMQVLWIPTTTVIAGLRLPVPRKTEQQKQQRGEYKKTDGDPIARTREIAVVEQVEGKALQPNIVSRVIQWFFVCYMIYNWCGNRGWVHKHDNGDIGESLRMSQWWVMYSMVGHRTATTQLIGFRNVITDLDANSTSTERIDLYAYLRTGGKELRQTDNVHSIPKNMTDRYPSPRWDRVLSQWANGHDPHGIRAQWFGKALCKLLNDDGGSTIFNRVELRYKPLQILEPGALKRYREDDSKPKPGKRDSVINVECGSSL